MRQKIGTAVRKSKGHKMLRSAAPRISSPHRNKRAERGNTWGCQAAEATSRDFGEAQPWPTNGMEKEEKLLVKKQLACENLLGEDIHNASQKWGKP